MLRRSCLLTLIVALHTLRAKRFLSEPCQFLLLATGLTMTKKEIVKTISEEMGLTQLKTKEIVQKTFDAIVEALVTEGRIELRNFGVFEVKKRAARKARNPRTGDKVHVPAKFVVTFKPGKEMEERVSQLEEKENRASMVMEQRHEVPLDLTRSDSLPLNDEDRFAG